MLKKITLFFLLNASLGLGFVTLQNIEQSEEYRSRQEGRTKASLALANYPREELGEALNSKAVDKLERWHQNYAKDLKLPLRWESHFEKVMERENFVDPQSRVLLEDLKRTVEEMLSLTSKRGWRALLSESKQMKALLDSQEFLFLSDKLTKQLNNYVSIVLNSELSTKNKELSLKAAANVEKALVAYQETQDEARLEQTWLKTFLSLPRELNSRSAYLVLNRSSHFFFWGRVALYILFFVLNFLLLWDWGRDPRRSTSKSTSKDISALEGLLCSKKAIEKSLIKCKKILQGKDPNFQIREWESHDVLFTNRMRDSLAEVFAEIASYKELKTKLSLCADEEQKVSCQIECSYLQRINHKEPSLVESLTSKVKQLAEELKPYKGELDWECLYNENGSYEVCLTVELPRAPV